MNPCPLRRPLQPREPDPWVIAHRGHSAGAPENTAAAFESAFEAPIDGIELDVQMSADGVPVIHHDATLAKLGGGRRRVSGMTLAALKALDAGAWKARRFRGEQLLTLSEVLDRWGGRTWLLLEIKARPEDREPEWHRAVTERTVDEVCRRGLERSVLLLSFDASVLDAARMLCPHVGTVLNLAKLPRAEPMARSVLEPLFAVSVDVRVLTPRFGELAHAMGKPVLSYTCNTPRSVQRAVAAGADALMADDPVRLASLLRVSADARA